MGARTARSNPSELKRLADRSRDPVVAQALRDLAAEYERMARVDQS